MGRLLAACDALAAELTTVAGVPASVERAKVHTPGAWVNPRTVEITTLSGGGTALVDLILVAADTGERNALAALEGLLEKVLTLPHLDVAEPIDTNYALILSGSPLPAFRVATHLEL
jgi:hypothetical protein